MDIAAVEQALHAMQAQLHAQQQQHQAFAAAAAAAAVAPARAGAHRVKIPAASNYTGAPSMLDSWLREMRQQFDWYEYTADSLQVAMAAAQLRGVALDWWSAQLSAAEQAPLRASFALFEKALRARFQPVNSAQSARLALDSLRQGAKQSVHDYTSAFRRLLVSVPDMSEADKVHRFVQGLRGHAQSQLILHGADTLDTAIAMAARVGSLTLYAASSAAAAGGAPMDLNAMHGAESPATRRRRRCRTRHSRRVQATARCHASAAQRRERSSAVASARPSAAAIGSRPASRAGLVRAGGAQAPRRGSVLRLRRSRPPQTRLPAEQGEGVKLSGPARKHMQLRVLNGHKAAIRPALLLPPPPLPPLPPARRRRSAPLHKCRHSTRSVIAANIRARSY